MKEQIEVTVTLDGAVTIQVKGVAGAKCLDLTTDLEADLGVVVERHKTPDFYATPETVRRVQAR